MSRRTHVLQVQLFPGSILQEHALQVQPTLTALQLNQSWVNCLWPRVLLSRPQQSSRPSSSPLVLLLIRLQVEFSSFSWKERGRIIIIMPFSRCFYPKRLFVMSANIFLEAPVGIESMIICNCKHHALPTEPHRPMRTWVRGNAREHGLCLHRQTNSYISFN
jgi:hypothetical protein